MKVNSCPDREALERLLLGLVPAGQAEALEEHLLGCDTCSAVAETIDPSDELTEAIRTRSVFERDEEAIVQVIERSAQLRRQAETVESQETQAIGDRESDGDGASGAARPEDITASVAAEIDFLSPPEQPDEIGRLGEYRVLQVLGVGGMGVVFRAEDPKLKRQVALKAMKPVVAASRSAKERFLKEAQAAAAIEHDHIVTIHHVGEDRGVPFIAMRYLRGESLQTRLDREQKLDQRDVVRIGRQIALGLAAAHERGLIHRDIKPDNIWLESNQDRVKIVDFGLVRSARDDSGLTQSGMVLGTPKYMAPEQAEGQEVDHRCDLFSLGSVLYQLASGRPPFQGGNLTATLIAVSQASPTPIETLCPQLNPDLARLITRLLSKDRDQRPQTAVEVAAALAEIEQKLASELEAEAKLRLAPTIEAAPPSVIAAPRAARRPSRRKPALWLSALFGAILVAGVITIVTAKGTVTIDIPDKMQSGVKVKILSDSGQVAVLDKANNWTVKLSGGAYTLDLQGGRDVFTLKDNKLTVSRFGQTVVQIEYTPHKALVQANPRNAPNNFTAGWPADAPPPAIAPFDAKQAKRHQEAWAKYLGVPVEYTNSIGMKFRLIPPGEFLMGSTPEEIEAALKAAGENQNWRETIQSEAPQHKVILTQPIYLGVHEVTQRDYEAVMGANPSAFATTGTIPKFVGNVMGMDTSSHPVEVVSWNDAAEFCAKLSQQEQLKPFYFRSGETVTLLDGTGYRLPTEAQWEFACRAGTTTRFWSGDQDKDLTRAGWLGANCGDRTHAVGELQANPFGLYDIHGNVWDWVQDGWSPNYYREFAVKPAIDPAGPSNAGDQRMVRGGTWNNSATRGRSSSRDHNIPAFLYHYVGFRVSLPVDAVKEAITKRSFKPVVTNHTSRADAPPAAIAPFNAEQAKQHQRAWANYLGVPVEKDVSLGKDVKLTMVLIPPGEFFMGSSDEERARFIEQAVALNDKPTAARIASEGPRRRVLITRPYWLAL